jgi:hypothetical protein
MLGTAANGSAPLAVKRASGRVSKRRPARVARAVLGPLLLVAAAGMPHAAAAKDWPPELFPLVPREHVELGAVRDVSEAPDGSIVLATGVGYPPSGGAVLRWSRAGELETLARFGEPVAAVLSEGDGSLLLLVGHRLVRLLPTGQSEAIAGTGQAGFSGDGGAARSAQMDILPLQRAGIARAPDGSIVFTDTGNDRLRRVRPDGVIETVAGTGAPCASPADASGDGGPALSATLCGPTAVLATADGGLVVSELWGRRIRRITPAGTIETIAGAAAGTPATPDNEGTPATQVVLQLLGGLAQLPGGDILFTDILHTGRITTDGRWLSVFHAVHGIGISDFAGRGPGWSRSVGVTREGGAVLSDGQYYLAPKDTAWTLAHIRGARADDRRLTVSFDASRPARATLQARLRGRVVATSTRAVDAGRRRLTLSGRFAPRRHEVRVLLAGPDGTAGRDEVELHLGGRLPLRAARVHVMSALDDGSVQSCRRLAVRRVRCTIDYDGERSTRTVTLTSSGVLRSAYP